MRRISLVGLICILLGACGDMPAAPRATNMLSAGAWTGDGCLAVSAAQCELVVGCGHGVFPPPVLAADGTFQVDGTFRVEAGPIDTNPPPPATFSGVVRGQTLTLTVTTRGGLSRASFDLQFSSTSGRCVTACV